ncbi:MAG: hypothetical protein HKN29_15765, partial [Rhodothermales bacterium]|nr:hypothetical protein [Rhodothermales bacterium]
MYRLLLITITLFIATGSALAQDGSNYTSRVALTEGLERFQGTCGGDSDAKLGQAVTRLRASLDATIWADADKDALNLSNGVGLFANDEAAADDLQRVASRKGNCVSSAVEALTQLFELDLDLADGAIAESGCDTAECSRAVSAAVAKRESAVASRSAGDTRKAISELGEAWSYAMDGAMRRSKATICHIPPGNPANRRTITVSSRSLAAHFGNHGDHFGTCSFEGSGKADLGLGSSSDDPMAPRGRAVKSKVRITNDGPDDATNMEITVDLPRGTYASATTTGDSEFDLATGVWKIPYVESLTTMELDLEGVATDELPTVTARITKSDQVDENTGNDAGTGMDSYSSAPVASTSGSDGGLESNGDLAAKIAARQFARAEDTRLGRVAPPLRRWNVASKSSGLDAFVPSAFPAGATPWVTTPNDLIGVTNATSALAVDWIAPGGSILGAMMVLETAANAVYEHSKVICDRLVGARVAALRVVQIEGMPFVLAAMAHEDGSVDYAISFAAYDVPGNWLLESRYRNAEYTPPSANGRTVNLQVWSVSPSTTVDLVRQIVTDLRSGRGARMENPEVHLPMVIARTAEYRDGRLDLEIDNMSGATTVVLAGSHRTTETAPALAFREAISLSEGVNRLSLDIGPTYDLGFTVDYGSSLSMDEVYVSDGAWG